MMSNLGALFSASAVSLAATAAAAEVTPFARNVTLHVLAHEVGHAVIREFDLPVLGNEEVMADTFALYFLTQTFPDQVGDIVLDRARSWRFEAEAGPVDAAAMMVEHVPDLRRAYRAVCLLFGTDPARYLDMARDFGLTESAARGCADSAPEVMRSWRRVMDTIWMPEGQPSGEVRVIYGEGDLTDAMREAGVMEDMEKAIRQIDWHSQITLHFDDCDGGAEWQRNGRRILLCGDYVARFTRQGDSLR